MRIDAHHHFWDPARGDYGWMSPDNSVLYRPYGAQDLDPQRKAARIDATVLVQAAPTVAETDYLLDCADATEWVCGVVGWIDFEDATQRRHLDRFARHPKFKGVRPMIQDIADPDWMHRPDIVWAFAALTEMDLTFDALGYPVHLPEFLRLLQRHPDLRTVIDHAMKPAIRDTMAGRDAFTGWAAGMTRLAQETQAVCKFSGMVTEAADGWTLETLRPFSDHLIGAFGAGRLMWGSDWPVCRLQAEYGDWHATAVGLTEGLDAGGKAAVFGGTAAQFYRIDL